VRRPALPIVAVVLVAALVALLAYGVVDRRDDLSLDSAVASGGRPASPGADVRLPKLDGTGTMRLSDLRGKVVVLNFWASWCDPACKEEAAPLERAHRMLLKSGGTVLGVTYKDAPEFSRAFVRENGVTYPNLRDDRIDLADAYGTNVSGRRVVAMRRGQVDDAFLTAAIARAKASPPVEVPAS
jgi:cytochrome c biogenesis protein CcmG, thiol:disulfide interchange protein DsbE